MGITQEGGSVRQMKGRSMLVILLLTMIVLGGCSYLGLQKKKGKEASEEEAKLVVKDEVYATMEEPQGAIKNYAGMVEDENVDWVWLKPETAFGRYRTVAIGLFKNYSRVSTPKMNELISEEVRSQLQKSGMTVTTEGEMLMDGAIVDVTLKGGVIEKIGKMIPGEYEDTGVTVCAEVVIGDAATNLIICKIRHQASAPELDGAIKKVADEVVRYIIRHR